MGTAVDRERVAKYVAARRGALGLTQERLAERAGVTIKTVYNLEAGERWPQARTRSAIEDALRWRAGDLVRIAGGDEPLGAEAEDVRGELAELSSYFAELRADPGEKRRTALAFLRVLYGER
ncbi:helix-turn-helix domain-containing protein [Spirillospora albida]|uniref:helix-turn-helix domain-containing protein n=1 Tax=Spirillospora albida TaxID=58123 RepID=UPI00068CAFF3|nr:helix-turn-helix transcriptional regulator [Spirillospora albida]